MKENSQKILQWCYPVLYSDNILMFPLIFVFSQKVSLIKVTDHPEYPTRAVLLCRDSSVRLASPDTGDILTTLLMPPGRGLVDAAYAVADSK